MYMNIFLSFRIKVGAEAGSDFFFSWAGSGAEEKNFGSSSLLGGKQFGYVQRSIGSKLDFHCSENMLLCGISWHCGQGSGSWSSILVWSGIVLAAERRNTNKLLDEVFHSEKIYKLNDDMACSVAGLTSDANLLTNELRWLIGKHLLMCEIEP